MILMIKNIFTLYIYKNIFTYLHLYTKIYLHYTYLHRPIYKSSRRPWTEEQTSGDGALTQFLPRTLETGIGRRRDRLTHTKRHWNWVWVGWG